MTQHIYTDTQLPWFNPREDLPRLLPVDQDQLTAMLRYEVGLDD